jgi:hypothetical protein
MDPRLGRGPHPGRGRVAAGLVRQPPALLGRADPAFYDGEKNAYLDAGVIRAVADKVEKRGTNLWYDSTPRRSWMGVKPPRRLAAGLRAHLRPRHARRLARLRLLPRRRARARPGRHQLAGRPLPRGQRPAPRLVPVLALDQRHRLRRPRPTGRSSPTASSSTRSRRRSPRARPTRSPRPATPTSPSTAPTSSASGSPPRTSGTTSRSPRRSSPTSARPTG